jgi:hypothetical protein
MVGLHELIRPRLLSTRFACPDLTQINHWPLQLDIQWPMRAVVTLLPWPNDPRHAAITAVTAAASLAFFILR